MSVEDILQALDEQCREECQSIFSEAQKEVDGILAKVEVEVEEIRARQAGEVPASKRPTRNRACTTRARLRAKNLVIEAKESVLSEALHRAQERIVTLRDNPDYPRVFEGLVLGSPGPASAGEGVVHVDPRDEQLARRVLKAKGNGPSRASADLELRGWASWSPTRRTGSTSSNTFDERLQQGSGAHEAGDSRHPLRGDG